MQDGISRRGFVSRSFGWTVMLAAGCAGRGARPGDAPPPPTSDPADPIDERPDLGNLVRPGALPFHREFLGDEFRRPHELIADPAAALRRAADGKLPPPDEEVPLVVVGGGLGGLAAAHLLRDLRPVVLEQAPRFGGNAKGERWRESVYGIGAAYWIRPDDGDALDRIYREIGLSGAGRTLESPDPVEYRGRIHRRFFDGEAGDAAAFATWRERLHHHAEEEYPDIPALDDEARRIVVALDRRSLRDVVRGWLGGEVPATLRAAAQNYCWSSMGCGWHEVSAAGAINFLAAEESGIVAHPGGNGALARALLRSVRGAAGDANLRPSSAAFRVRNAPEGVHVSYADPAGRVRTVLARAAVLGCPKFVVKHVLQDLEPDRERAIRALTWRGYMVVNVLVDRGLEEDFYDLYLLRDGAEEALPEGRATDVILGNWARVPGLGDQSVLTLYWPLPTDDGRRDVLYRHDAFAFLRPHVEARTLEVLALLGIDPGAVVQVRMARWGHAVPVSAVGFIADGHADVLRRPVGERVFFVNQDNWALPAVETCLTEAIDLAPRIRAACS